MIWDACSYVIYMIYIDMHRMPALELESCVSRIHQGKAKNSVSSVESGACPFWASRHVSTAAHTVLEHLIRQAQQQAIPLHHRHHNRLLWADWLIPGENMSIPSS